jgi:predicted regulator of Ras-like GTPase activity (Roadblock/LC7/MglB family)
MTSPTTVVLENDHHRFISILERLREEANSKFVFLVDKSGQQIASSGELREADPTALASLAAGNVAATEGLAQLIGEDEFSTLFHEGHKDSLHISLISDRIILLVIFDEHSSLGLVRLRVKQRVEELEAIVQEMMDRATASAAPSASSSAALAEITDEDIDALFG